MRLGLSGLQSPAARSMKGKQLYDGQIVSNCTPQTKTDFITFSWLFWKMCCERAAQLEWPRGVNPPRKPWPVPAITREGSATASVRSASKTGCLGAFILADIFSVHDPWVLSRETLRRQKSQSGDWTGKEALQQGTGVVSSFVPLHPVCWHRQGGRRITAEWSSWSRPWCRVCHIGPRGMGAAGGKPPLVPGGSVFGHAGSWQWSLQDVSTGHLPRRAPASSLPLQIKKYFWTL